METSLAHLVPEFTANLVGPILLLGYMLREIWAFLYPNSPEIIDIKMLLC